MSVVIKPSAVRLGHEHLPATAGKTLQAVSYSAGILLLVFTDLTYLLGNAEADLIDWSCPIYYFNKHSHIIKTMIAQELITEADYDAAFNAQDQGAWRDRFGQFVQLKREFEPGAES